MYCEKCGAELKGNKCPNCDATTAKDQGEYNKFKGLLYDASEKVVAVLGNNVAQRFIATGVLGNGFAVLSDKRVYFKGKCLIRKGKGFYTNTEEKSVDIKDVTGTGFVHHKAIWAKVLKIIFIVLSCYCAFLILMGLLFGTINTYEPIKEDNFEMAEQMIPAIPFMLAMVFLCHFLYKRYSFSAFEISYAGGGIAFGLHWIGEQESYEFQKELNLLKDSLKGNEDPKPPIPPAPPSDDIPEQLRKFKELLDSGIITQQEFDAKKKQLLGI